MTAPDGELKIVEKLLALQELEGIGDVALLDLARNTRIEKFASGSILRADEHTERRLYLLIGSVTLHTEGKTPQTVEADTERALLSLFRVRTHGLTAHCQSTVELLSIDETIFERHVALIRPNDSGIAVAEYLQDSDEPSIVTEARLDFTHAEVDLPSMPEAAIRIYDILKHDDIDIRRVADVVKIDPIIAVRIVQVANSAFYRTSVVVESIKDAISHIGLNATRAIVMSVVLNNLFTPQSKLIHHYFKKFYHHSVRVAAIAYILAKQLKSFDPDEALLAGLIHDIGVVPILIEADHNKNFIEHEIELEEVLQQQSHKIGAILLKQWGFEKVFIAVAQDSENWGREVEQADYCDLIQVAQLHCNMVGGRKMMAPSMSDIPAFKRLGLDNIDPQSIIKEAKYEIHEILDLLSSP